MVTKVNEDNSAMVADTVDPSGNPDCFSGISFGKLAACVGSELVHF
jgi:hypothetical protein